MPRRPRTLRVGDAHLRPRRTSREEREGGSAGVGAGAGSVGNLEVSWAQTQLEQEANHPEMRTLNDCTQGGLGSKSRRQPGTV